MNNYDELSKIINEDNINDFKFFDSHEGTLVRMFFYNNKWYVTTHRKLDAYKSKWASRESFGEQFQKCINYELENNEKLKELVSEYNDLENMEKFKKILNEEKQYMFLLLNTETNRIVCQPLEYPKMFHVGTMTKDSENINYEDEFCIEKPRKHSFENINDLLDYCSKVDISKIQGVICFKGNMTYKILNEFYDDFFKVRGNEPSIKFRYLQIRNDIESANKLRYLYYDYNRQFDIYEDTLYEIATEIYNAYVDRFIKRQFVTVPSENFRVIKRCHELYKEDRLNNKIKFNTVINILNEQTPTSLNVMIKRKLTQNKRLLKPSNASNPSSTHASTHASNPASTPASNHDN